MCYRQCSKPGVPSPSGWPVLGGLLGTRTSACLRTAYCHTTLYPSPHEWMSQWSSPELYHLSLVPLPFIYCRQVSDGAKNVGYRALDIGNAVVYLRCPHVTFTLGTGCSHCLLFLCHNLNYGLQDYINQLFSVSSWDEIFSVNIFVVRALKFESEKHEFRVLFFN